MAKGTKNLDLGRGLPPNTPVSWRTSKSSSGVMPETSRATCSTQLRAARLLRSQREEAGDQHQRQEAAARSLQVHHHLCLLWEEEALRG